MVVSSWATPLIKAQGDFLNEFQSRKMDSSNHSQPFNSIRTPCPHTRPLLKALLS